MPKTTPAQRYFFTRPLRGLISSIVCVSILINPVLAYSPYTNSELDQLEKEFIEQINQSDSVLRDPLASQYINHLANTLAINGQLTAPYFFIVKSNEINAFAGPGGYIGVNSQLILATENESELAAVMAHEMAHVRLHHLYRMIEHQKQMRIPMLAAMLASIALGVINPSIGSGAMMASLTGFAQDSVSFVRSNEKEADRIGIDMLIKSGLDPRGMAGFFKKMQQSTRYYYTSDVPAILRTHPLDDDRIAEAENRSLHLAKKAYPDHLDYHLFKALVRTAVMDNRKQALDFYASQSLKNPSIINDYGYALTLLAINRYNAAEIKLAPLLHDDPNNIFFNIAMAQAALGRAQYKEAIQRLYTLQENYPDNYAAVVSYAQSLLAGSQTQLAASTLLKASRQFKNDLPICQQLARAQAAANRKDYAYFTEAQCELLQGHQKEALRRLKLAQTLVTQDHFLKARIKAKIEEINFLLPLSSKS